MEVAKLYKYLPFRVRLLMEGIPAEVAGSLNEIRLRANLPFSLSVGSRNLSVNEKGKICKPEEGVSADDEEMKECVSKLTKSSLYSFDETIKKGYIPLEGGARAGICGDAVSGKDGIKTFSSIRSISIRVSRLYPDLALPLAKRFFNEGPCGTLVFSPPGVGKTTYLRSAAYLLSKGKKPYRVGIADERSEIFVPEMAGCLIDFVRGCRKRDGIDLLTRTMSPQIIICDEISDDEAEGVIAAQNSGVRLVASCHGDCAEGIMKRPHIARMMQKGIFELLVRLWHDGEYGSELMEWSKL